MPLTIKKITPILDKMFNELNGPEISINIRFQNGDSIDISSDDSVFILSVMGESLVASAYLLLTKNPDPSIRILRTDDELFVLDLAFEHKKAIKEFISNLKYIVPIIGIDVLLNNDDDTTEVIKNYLEDQHILYIAPLNIPKIKTWKSFSELNTKARIEGHPDFLRKQGFFEIDERKGLNQFGKTSLAKDILYLKSL